MTTGFSGKIVVEQWEQWWVLREPLVYECADGTIIRVPELFVTDFASVPRPLWWLLPPADPAYSRAGLVHDRLYETHAVDRASADAIFYEAMRVSGTGILRAWPMYRAVRLGGGASYASGAARQAARHQAYADFIRHDAGPDPR